MPTYPSDPIIQAEARRLAAEDLDRDLHRVAELLAEQGHHGPDGKPYPGRTVANLLDEELRRRRDDRWRERNREAVGSFNEWFLRHGHESIVGGAGAMPQDAADSSGLPEGKALVMDNLPARRRFFEEVPCLTSEEVAALAGHTARNGSMTASRWKQAGRIFSVPGPREDVYPAFQFQDGKPHPTVARVLAELPKRKSPWQVAFWFVSNNGWLGGATPAARLADGDTVVAAARHEAEDIIG
jgi:hypothetical protein